MKCPNCSQSLWFSRSFCPFCKAPIPEAVQPRVAQSVILNRTVFAAWSVFFAYQLFFLVTHQLWDPLWRRSLRNSTEWGSAVGGAFGGPIMVGIAVWLAWRLYARPPRLSTTIWFIVVCAILIWRNWLGAILMFMHPLFGHTFLGAVAQWWSASTSSLYTAMVMLFPPPFLIFSMIFWPIYCRRIERQETDSISSLAQRLRQSDHFKVYVGVGVLILIWILSALFSR